MIKISTLLQTKPALAIIFAGFIITFPLVAPYMILVPAIMIAVGAEYATEAFGSQPFSGTDWLDLISRYSSMALWALCTFGAIMQARLHNKLYTEWHSVHAIKSFGLAYAAIIFAVFAEFT